MDDGLTPIGSDDIMNDLMSKQEGGQRQEPNFSVNRRGALKVFGGIIGATAVAIGLSEIGKALRPLQKPVDVPNDIEQNAITGSNDIGTDGEIPTGSSTPGQSTPGTIFP